MEKIIRTIRKGNIGYKKIYASKKGIIEHQKYKASDKTNKLKESR